MLHQPENSEKISLMGLLPLIFLVVLSITGLAINYWLFRNKTAELEEKNQRLQALHGLDEIVMASYTDVKEVAQRVTDSISTELKLDLGVLALVDETRGVLKRVAMSRTQVGNQAKRVLPFPYEQLEIPLMYQQNLAIKAVLTGQVQVTHNLYDLFVPVLDQKISNEIQQTVGVKTSLVYPIKARGKIIGIMIISLAREQVELKSYENETIENLIDVIGIALDNALLYQNLKATSEKLKQANAKLQEVDELKDDFVSIASHELRTPMTAIRSYVWMALNRADTPLSAKMTKYLQRTLISTERLINLVNEMLNISRIESGRISIAPKVFDIHILVDDVVSEVEPKVREKNITLEVIKQKMPQVFADPDKVYQILLNLVGNAIKFTPENGKITISFFSDGYFIETSVKDSGVGISAEDLQKLFKKFGRLESSYQAAAMSGGTGLGLYITKNLVELMKGKIAGFSDGHGKGSTFVFSLPVATTETVQNVSQFTVKPEGESRGLEPIAI